MATAPTSAYIPEAQTLLALHEELLRSRLIEERMLTLLRQGQISKWFSGIGQEAVSVGAALALSPSEYVFPQIRNLGVFTSRRVPLVKLFKQLFGKAGGYTAGRDSTASTGVSEQCRPR